MKGFLLGFLKGLKLPVKLLAEVIKRRRKKKSEREEKQKKHVRNFTKRNISWQKVLGGIRKRKKSLKNRKEKIKYMPAINLKNISIDERQTISGETFFVIKDNDQNQVYFCFQNKLKEGWQDLVSDKENIKEVEIEYIENEKGNKVVSLYASKEGDFLV